MTEQAHPHPPVAPKRPKTLSSHGHERTDDWFWLREKDNPEVIALLEAENSFTASQMADTQAAQQHLFDEIVGRIQETDLSVPVRKGSWWYYHRTEEGKQYAIHCRTADTGSLPGPDAPDSVLLDENVEAGDADFFSLGAFDVSPDARLLAYSVDTDGDEIFTMHIRDLVTGANLTDTIEHTSYGTAWAKDGSVLFYVRPDATQRPYQVWRHRIGSESSTDELVYQEDDERFFVGVGNSKTDDYISIVAGSSLTSEVHFLRSDNPLGDFAVVEPRRQGIEYHVAHHRSASGDQLFVMTNEDAPNFKLMVTTVDAPGRDEWTEIVAHRDDVKLDDIEVFAMYLVLAERAEATARLAVLDLATGQRTVLEQPETVYSAHTGSNPEFDSTTLRYSYTSLVTPNSVYEIDLVTQERTLLKQQPVLGSFNSADYTSERLWAEASDGTKIPISLVYRRDRPTGPGPALLYGYGSYEISMDPSFSSLRLSLLDRGFMFAIAHIRGGGDMGRLWYEHGKFFEKKNTFTDFIACAEHLIEQRYTDTRHLLIRGGSAGGLLMGAVANMRPDLFAGIIAEVPFVDALSTMLDASLPLTVHEYEEWGNPEAEKAVYEYMLSYSPYDNVTAQNYPTMLITGGLNDPRVSYWEPEKWAQKLRDMKTDGNEILVKMEMGAGHMGPSGRYDTWRDEAFIYSFMFRALDITPRFL